MLGYEHDDSVGARSGNKIANNTIKRLVRPVDRARVGRRFALTRAGTVGGAAIAPKPMRDEVDIECDESCQIGPKPSIKIDEYVAADLELHLAKAERPPFDVAEKD